MTIGLVDTVEYAMTDGFAGQSRQAMLAAFSKRRQDGKLSLAHAEDHMTCVARYAALTAWAIGKALGVPDELCIRMARMAAIAGWWHDMTREATEMVPHGPASAKLFREGAQSDMVAYQIEIIDKAIEFHEGPFSDKIERFGDPVEIWMKGTRDPFSIEFEHTFIRSVVGIALKIADGVFEASGWQVIARRAFFVGRERVLHGDLQNIIDPKEPEMAFIGETLIRLYAKLAIVEFPMWLRPLGEQLHAVQYRVLAGLLLHTAGWDEFEAAKWMLEKGFPKYTQELLTRIWDERHLDGNHFKPGEYPVLAKVIGMLNEMVPMDDDALAEASVTTIRCIAFAETPEEGIQALWQRCQEPHGRATEYLKDFHDGIQGYREGSVVFMTEAAAQMMAGISSVTGKNMA